MPSGELVSRSFLDHDPLYPPSIGDDDNIAVGVAVNGVPGSHQRGFRRREHDTG